MYILFLFFKVKIQNAEYTYKNIQIFYLLYTIKYTLYNTKHVFKDFLLFFFTFKNSCKKLFFFVHILYVKIYFVFFSIVHFLYLYSFLKDSIH